jgi:phage gpG-like protein
MAKKELGDQEQLRKLYNLAMKKASSKKAAKKFTSNPKNAKREVMYSPLIEGEKRFTKKLTKKYGDWTDVLGTAKSYTDKVRSAKKTTKDMRKKMS